MSNNEKYSFHCNDCLRGQVDKEEDYRSRGWEFKSSCVSTTKNIGTFNVHELF